MISGVLPRFVVDDLFYSKTFSLNNYLRNLCKDHGVEFVDMWNNFYKRNMAYIIMMVYTCKLWGPLGLADCLAKRSVVSGQKTVHAQVPL